MKVKTLFLEYLVMRIMVHLFLVIYVPQTISAQSHLDSLAQRLRLFELTKNP